MPDISAIAGLAGSLKAISDLTKAMIGIRDGAMLQSKVIELNGIILTAQQEALAANIAQATLLEEKRQLETKIAEMEKWDAKEKRYKLTDYGGGTFAYELKPEAADGEPIHRTCPNCFQNRHIQILQFDARTADKRDRYTCPSCKVAFDFGVAQPWQPPPVNRGRGRSWMGA